MPLKINRDFAVARGGTILLDEIADTSPAFQVRLLRVLEEQEFQALGAVKKEKADVRIIAATNRDLSKMVNDEKFRQDLFYRINIMRIEIPPLRKRMEDIPILIDHFIDKLNRIRGKSISGIDPNALEILMSHKFPGNIRELENIIEHAFVLCSEGNILPRHFPKTLNRQALSLPEASCSSSMDQLKAAEIKIITDALKKNYYNRTAAAKALGMHKSTLFRKIDKLGIRLPKIDGRCRTQEEK